MNTQPKQLGLGWSRIDDARRFVPASRAQYYIWIAEGKIRTARVGGARYVDMDSLKQLFETAARKKIPKRVSDRMRERAYASQIARAQKERK
jgi:hypothetical protein